MIKYTYYNYMFIITNNLMETDVHAIIENV